MLAKIRKIVTLVEEVRSEMGRAVDPPTRRAAAIAVIENPSAGRYIEDLSDLMAIGSELGGVSARMASSNMRRRSCTPAWAGRCGPRSAGVPP